MCHNQSHYGGDIPQQAVVITSEPCQYEAVHALWQVSLEHVLLLCVLQ